MTKDNKILLVDDESGILNSLKRILAREGYQIFTANSGQEGLDLLKNENVDVIVSDQRMPVMNGDEFLAQAKELQPDAVRMMLSGYADFDAVVNSINNGSIHKFINKPWNDNTVREEVKGAFDLIKNKKKSTELDPLTGLLNRTAFMEEMENIPAGEPYVLLYVNLDRFINVNSAYGVKTGDEVLVLVANRLTAWTNIREGFLSRVGSDEFVICIPKNDSAHDLAASLKDEFNSPFQTLQNSFNIKASIGAMAADGKLSHEECLNCANNAVKAAKKQGRNVFKVFDKTIELFLDKDAEIERSMYSVLKTDQLFLVYQPLVDLNGHTKGAEALLRWNHPVYGYLTPKDFIEISEDTNMICDIGPWCLERSIKEISEINKELGKDLYISVNLSPRQILYSDSYAVIKDLLDKTKFKPELLEVEVTESVVISDPSKCKKALDDIASLGVKVVLDDFGTGYSSLSYLRQFPFKKIKIDGSYVRELETSENALKMFASIINMGRSLDLEITVEGIETQGQYDILKKQSCDYLQGYFFSKPVEKGEFISKSRK